VRNFNYTFFHFVPVSQLSMDRAAPSKPMQTLRLGTADVAVIFSRVSEGCDSARTTASLPSLTASVSRTPQPVLYGLRGKPDLSWWDSRGPSRVGKNGFSVVVSDGSMPLPYDTLINRSASASDHHVIRRRVDA
jgi:hypothetical protein